VKIEYLIVLGAVLFFPLVLSTDRNLGLYRNRRSLARAIITVALPFWIWDVIVTARGHWSFNDAYIIGLNILGMPIEEWLFFLVVPFVSIFTWESTKYFLRRKK
jgi:lycopene cyclase domain-containing protein